MKLKLVVVLLLSIFCIASLATAQTQKSHSSATSTGLECAAAEIGFSMMGMEDAAAPAACTKLCVNPGRTSHCQDWCECKGQCTTCCTDNFEQPDRGTCIAACNAATWTC